MNNNSFLLVTGSFVYKLNLAEVLYIEKNGREAVIVTEKDSICCNRTSKQLKRMVDERFMCCHRHFMINMDYIMKMGHQKISLRNDSEIYFGQETFRKAKHIFIDYMGKEKTF